MYQYWELIAAEAVAINREFSARHRELDAIIDWTEEQQARTQMRLRKEPTSIVPKPKVPAGKRPWQKCPLCGAARKGLNLHFACGLEVQYGLLQNACEVSNLDAAKLKPLLAYSANWKMLGRRAAECHPNKANHAGGLCETCYRRKKRASEKAAQSRKTAA